MKNMVKLELLILFVSLLPLLVSYGCSRINPTEPSNITLSPPPQGNSSNTNTNTDGNITIIINIPPPVTIPPTDPTTPLPPEFPSGVRTPDPPIGQSLPLPAYTRAAVNEVHTANPNLILSSCIFQFGSAGWQFMDKVIDRLRLNDTRWGYACVPTGTGPDCNSPNPEFIAYHATAGPDVMGAQGIITVDIIENYCSAPTLGYINRGFASQDRWSTRNRF